MGMGRSVPITNLHVQRTSNPLFNSAVCEIQGFRDTQEDAHNIVEKINDHGIMLFGVYDGHGGSLCSRYLSQEIPAAFSKLEKITDYAQIIDICIQVDRTFMNFGKPDGSTSCIVLAQLCKRDDDSPIEDYKAYLREIKNNRAAFIKTTRVKLVSINIGDSRAVILRRLALFPDLDRVTGQPCDDESLGDSAYFQPITVDHKPTDALEHKRIQKAGGFVEMGRVDGSLALSRAFGDVQYKVPQEAPPAEQKVTVVPDFQMHYLDWGDVLFLSCDGIFEVESMTYSEVAQELVLSVIKGSKFQNEKPLDGNSLGQGAETKSEPSQMADGESGTGAQGADGEGKEKDQNGKKSDSTSTTTDNSNQTDVKLDENGMELDSSLDYEPLVKVDGTVPPTDSLLYNFDPALPCRDIIQRSLELGSKDNHTAMIVSFKPPMFLTPDVVSLPKQEIIPGPYNPHSGDFNFDQDYVNDIGTAMDDPTRELIGSLDQLWTENRFQYNHPHTIALVKKKLIESNHSPLMPIMYGSYGTQPQVHQAYGLNPYAGMAHYTGGYDDDDDDDDGGF